MKRSGSAVWKGGLKDGTGNVSTESGVLANIPYNFSKRFESEKGTNPEELIAAAHAACFSMALSAQLGNAGMKADSINTTATVSLEQVEGGFAVTSSHLETTVVALSRERVRRARLGLELLEREWPDAVTSELGAAGLALPDVLARTG